MPEFFNFLSQYTECFTLSPPKIQLPEEFGLIEGLGYLATVGIAGYSVYTKVTTGSGLPAGPYGLVGAVEGIAWLSALGGIGAVAYHSFSA